MEQIVPADIFAASQEIQSSKRPMLRRYIKNHTARLLTTNPQLGELIGFITQKAQRLHGDMVTRTPEESSEYIAALLLLLVRTIEIAETRIATDEPRVVMPIDPNTLTEELIARLSRPK